MPEAINALTVWSMGNGVVGGSSVLIGKYWKGRPSAAPSRAYLFVFGRTKIRVQTPAIPTMM